MSEEAKQRALELLREAQKVITYECNLPGAAGIDAVAGIEEVMETIEGAS